MLSKIAEAFFFSKKSLFANDPLKGDGVLGEGSVLIGASQNPRVALSGNLQGSLSDKLVWVAPCL